MSAFLVVCGSFARIHARASPQMRRKLCWSVTNFSLLALGANRAPCWFSFLPPSRLCFVSGKKCEILLAEDESNHSTHLMAMSGFGKLRHWGPAGGVFSYYSIIIVALYSLTVKLHQFNYIQMPMMQFRTTYSIILTLFDIM